MSSSSVLTAAPSSLGGGKLQGGLPHQQLAPRSGLAPAYTGAPQAVRPGGLPGASPLPSHAALLAGGTGRGFVQGAGGYGGLPDRRPAVRQAPARVLAEDGASNAASLGSAPASSAHAAALDRSHAAHNPMGIDGNPTMFRGSGQTLESFVRYERSFSIQDALDQHANLAEQREVLVETARNRLRIRNTQLRYAELEVEETLDATQAITPSIAGDTQQVLQKASSLRAVVRDLRLAQQQRNMEQGQIDKHISLADIEIEKSRKEMTSMKEVIDDKSLVMASDETQPAPQVPKDENGKALEQKYRYCTNCKVGGHGQRFCEYFLERPNWRVYPHQKWFEDEKANEYHCPLGKKLVDFADESHFSRIAMYLKGRAWLEEKTKVLELAGNLIPETFIIDKGVWKDGKEPPADDAVTNLPWFVKEADRNWGTSVHVCSKPSECMALAKPDSVYVVQQHIADPLLMPDGRKCHIKFYVLLVGLEDGIRWHLYTFKDGYLSISPNAWSPTDISKETQVTIIRSERINEWEAWDAAYPKCKESVGKVMHRAVELGKLEGRLGKKQFEILSADFIVNTDGDVWLFEFNMSPVLKDPKDAPEVNDADMIRGALHIVDPCEGGSVGLWDFVGEYCGEPPQPKIAQPAAKANPTPPADPATGAEAAENGSENALATDAAQGSEGATAS